MPRWSHRALYESIITDLATTQQLLDFALLEEQDEHTATVLVSARPRAMVRHAQAVILIVAGLLGRTQEREWEGLEPARREEDGESRR